MTSSAIISLWSWLPHNVMAINLDGHIQRLDPFTEAVGRPSSGHESFRVAMRCLWAPQRTCLILPPAESDGGRGACLHSPLWINQGYLLSHCKKHGMGPDGLLGLLIQ